MSKDMENAELCDFPGCLRPAICASGNVGGALVCREHFRITNGKTAEEVTAKEKDEMMAAYMNYKSRTGV